MCSVLSMRQNHYVIIIVANGNKEEVKVENSSNCFHNNDLAIKIQIRSENISWISSIGHVIKLCHSSVAVLFSCVCNYGADGCVGGCVGGGCVGGQASHPVN